MSARDAAAARWAGTAAPRAADAGDDGDLALIGFAAFGLIGFVAGALLGAALW